MRILYASERPPYPFFLGGAARCAHKLLHSLSGELGVPCAAVGSSDYTVTPWAFPDPSDYGTLGVKAAQPNAHGGGIDCGYPVVVIADFVAGLDGFIDQFKPSLIWAQLEGAKEVLHLASKRNIQGLLYLHDAEFDPNELRAVADLGCHIVCNSEFLAEKTNRVTRRRAHVVYPAAELYFGTEGDPNGYVTMINPHRVKGIDTFFAIAQRLPSQKFLLLESWKLNAADLATLQAQLAGAPNVRFVRRVSDMRSIYRETKLLLVPSVWEEGFGMVAIEAQSCGIPVIASARGGLPESVGDGGILIRDYLNVDAWVEAINPMLGNVSVDNDWSRRALRHASADNFAPTQLARRFLEACSAAPPRTAAHSRVLNAARDRLQKIPVLDKLMRRAFR